MPHTPTSQTIEPSHAAAPAPAAPPAHSAAPATQLAPAIVTLAAAPPGAARQVTIRLDPAELGQVQLRITHSGTAAAPQIEIAVERPATLHLLVQDRDRLDQALDRAGIPADGRVVQFSLAPPQATPDPAPTQASPPTTSAQQGAQQDTSRQAQDHPQHGGQHQTAYRGRGGPAFDDALLPGWSRTTLAGIDITA